MRRGLGDLYEEIKLYASDYIHGIVAFTTALIRRERVLPLVRRFSLGPSSSEYEAIPMDLERGRSPVSPA
jgi:hypothetical protein